MKRNAVLSIRGRQTYADQEPEVIELVTEGTMEFRNGGWDISYEESALTGLEGVTTTFRVEPGKVLLTRTGKLQSLCLLRHCGGRRYHRPELQSGHREHRSRCHRLSPGYPGKVKNKGRTFQCVLFTFNLRNWNGLQSPG